MSRKRRRGRPSLDGFDVKVKRARTHLAALREANAKISQDGAYKFVGEIAVTAASTSTVSSIPRRPIQWSAIAGDCVHNLRSALDYLACQLVRISGNEPTSNTSFPLWRDRSRLLHGVRSDILQVIRSVQPYHRGNRIGERLWMLRQLDNIDKHRQLLMAAVFIPATSWHPSPNSPQSLRFDYFVKRVSEIIEHDQVTFKVVYEKPNAYLTPNLKGRPSIFSPG